MHLVVPLLVGHLNILQKITLKKLQKIKLCKYKAHNLNEKNENQWKCFLCPVLFVWSLIQWKKECKRWHEKSVYFLNFIIIIIICICSLLLYYVGVYLLLLSRAAISFRFFYSNSKRCELFHHHWNVLVYCVFLRSKQAFVPFYALFYYTLEEE